MISYCLNTRTKVNIEVLLGPEYTPDEKFGNLVGILRTFIAPLPFSGKKKKGKSQTMSKPKPMTQGLKASGTLPQKRKKVKTDKTTLEATEKPPTEDVLTEYSEKTQLVSSGQTAHPKIQRETHNPLVNVHPTDKGLPSTVSDEGIGKTKPLPEGSYGYKDSEGFKPPADMEPSTTHVADLSETDAKYQVDQTQSTRLRYWSLTKNKGKLSYEWELGNQPLILSTTVDVQAILLSDEELMEESEDDVFEAGDEMDEDIHHTNEEETQSPSPNIEQPELSHVHETTESDSGSSCPEVLKRYDNVLPLTERQLVQYLLKVSQALYNRLTEDQWEKHEEAAASYVDLKSEIEGFHDTAYKYGKDVEKILGSLKFIQDAVKEDPILNKKVIKATEVCIKNSTNLTELLTLIKSFEFQGLKSSVKSLQASALRQDKHLAAWAKSSTSMAWSLGPRLTNIELTQAAIQSDISSLKQYTFEIKFMMSKIFCAFKGQTPPSSSVPTTTLAITRGSSNLEKEIAKEPEKEQAEEEPAKTTRAIPISTVIPITRPNPEIRLIELSSRPPLTDTTLEFLVSKPETEIIGSSSGPVIDITPPEQPESPPVDPKADKGKGIAIKETGEPTKKLMPASREVRQDPNEPIKKAAEEARLLAMSKPELIKVVHKEALNIRIDPKKVKRQMELRNKRLEQYTWTTSSRIKPEPITDVKIHPNTKPAVLTVYRGNDRRNFDVHNPFKFVDFVVTESDELGPFIEKKKNKIVGELMISLGKRYERLKKIPKELRIQSALPFLYTSTISILRKKKEAYGIGA
ncbi:hypothetical protein Tco_0974644 [Tanacetum coccineum]|uniref:Uncharacterized protein n=1 Tax=Tanacetum coccineum TaxID=301880 RepID=A0ABQ5EC98_9ASTR